MALSRLTNLLLFGHSKIKIFIVHYSFFSPFNQLILWRDSNSPLQTTDYSTTCQVILVETINRNLPQFYFRAQSLKDFLICFADGGDGSCELKDRLSLLRVRLQVSFFCQEVQLQSLDSASMEFESHWFSFSSKCPLKSEFLLKRLPWPDGHGS